MGLGIYATCRIRTHADQYGEMERGRVLTGNTVLSYYNGTVVLVYSGTGILCNRYTVVQVYRVTDKPLYWRIWYKVAEYTVVAVYRRTIYRRTVVSSYHGAVVPVYRCYGIPYDRYTVGPEYSINCITWYWTIQ